MPIFLRPADYRAFLRVLKEGLESHDVKLLAFCVLSNHWHLVVKPAGIKELSVFMKWVTSTHAMRWHSNRKTRGQGSVYQGRFTAQPLEMSGELVTVCRYVERNALSAGLVARAQDWPWCSLAERQSGASSVPLVSAPFLVSNAWIDYVNAILTLREHARLERSVPQVPETVEKRYDPLQDVANAPSAGTEQGERIVHVGRADGQNQADAHVERAEHLRVVNVRRTLKP